MAIKQAVTTIFKSKDESVNKNFKRMGKSADKFGEKGSRAFKKVSKSATSAGTIMKGVLGAGLVSNALGLIGQGLSTVTTQFVQFDDAITASSAKFKGLDLTTKEGIKTLALLKKSARETGAETKFNAVEAAQGLDFYATAGFNAAQAMAVLKPTAKLATIANTDLARTSDIASDSLGAFGLMTKDSAQLQKNFTRLSDVMAKTLTSTNVNMEDMFEAVKKGAPTFTATGQSVETFNALIGIMANSTLKGSEAGTQLRNMMLRLAKPTEEAQDALDAIGVRTRDNKGNFLDIVKVLGQFEKGLEGMGTAQRAAALKTIFGVRSITGLNILLQEGSKNIGKFRGELKKAGGTTESMAEVMNKSLGNRLKGLGSALTEVGFQFLSAFETQGAGAISVLTKAVRSVNLKQITEGIKKLFEVGGKLFDKFVDIGERTGLFDNAKKSIENIEPIFNTLEKAVTAIWGAFERTLVFDALSKSFVVLLKSLSPMTKAFELMWRTVAPILKGLEIVFGQKIKNIIFVLDLLGIAIDAIDKKLGKDVSALRQIEIVNTEGEQDFIKKDRDKEEEKKERIITSRTIPGENRLPGVGDFKRSLAASQRKAPEKFKRMLPFAANRKSGKPAQRVPPPQQNSTFRGTLDIAGAPEGSELRQQSSGPGQIDVKMKNRGKPIFQEAG